MKIYKTTTWLFAAALLGSAAVADAKPPPGEPDHREAGWDRKMPNAKPAPRVDPNTLRWTSRSGSRAPLTLVDPKFRGETEGTVEDVVDGYLMVSNPLTEEARKAIAARTGAPLSTVTDRTVRRLRIPPDGPSEAEFESRIGQRLQLELKRDIRGNLMVSGITKRLGPGLQPLGVFRRGPGKAAKPTR